MRIYRRRTLKAGQLAVELMVEQQQHEGCEQPDAREQSQRDQGVDIHTGPYSRKKIQSSQQQRNGR